MWLQQITLKDFRCFFDEHTISFSQDMKQNVTLIHAENGVGKTTLLNALLWCFYGETTDKFEKKDDLVNYDALAAGRVQAFVEVLFEHNGGRYRARRYTKGSHESRQFTIMRIDGGHHTTIANPGSFINTVVPRDMAGHFLFDGEHAEVFLGEDNRSKIRTAVQDILGCSLIKTAIDDLRETATYYRKLAPSSKATNNLQNVNDQIGLLTDQIRQAGEARNQLAGDIETIDQQVADIDDKLRNSAAAAQLQKRRDKTSEDLVRARKRETTARDTMLKWLGENGRFFVSSAIADMTMDHLNKEETKGKIPSPYNEEFVSDLLELQKCICGADLLPGTPERDAVAALMQKAANATLRSRIGKIRARIAELKQSRTTAPAKLTEAKEQVDEARQDISRCEADLHEISEQLAGIDFDEIAKREARRNALKQEANEKREGVGRLDQQILDAESQKSEHERELKRLADADAGARIFIERFALCRDLADKLEKELGTEEEQARGILRASISRILGETSRKAFRLKMTSDYGISLVNAAGTQLPKSSGENQLLGLAFTAALVEFAKTRQNAQDYRLLRGTVAPLVLDSPFGQLDEDYRKTTAEHVPQMAGQVILLISKSQGSGGVIEALRSRVGAEYVLVRHNKDDRAERTAEVRQFNGKDVETAVFAADFDGSSFVEVTRG